MPRLHVGTIEGFRGSWGSGLGSLVIDGAGVPCDNSCTVRALEAAFGNVIGPGHTVDNENGSHVGQEIIYWMDDFGLVMAGFCPIDEWLEAGYDLPDDDDDEWDDDE